MNPFCAASAFITVRSDSPSVSACTSQVESRPVPTSTQSGRPSARGERSEARVRTKRGPKAALSLTHGGTSRLAMTGRSLELSTPMKDSSTPAAALMRRAMR